MSIADQEMRNHARELVGQRIKQAREASEDDPLSWGNEYAALVEMVVRFLGDPSTENEERLRHLVGWPK